MEATKIQWNASSARKCWERYSDLAKHADWWCAMQITVVQKAGKDAVMTKVFSQSIGGGITKDASQCSMVRGSARRVDLGDDPRAALEALERTIQALEPSEALVLGTFDGDSDEVRVVQDGQVNDRPYYIARTRDHLNYARGPGIVLLDLDVSGFTPELQESIRDSGGDAWHYLQMRIPLLNDVLILRRPSSSALVQNELFPIESGAEQNEHGYVVVTDASRWKQLADALKRLCADAGAAFIKISRAGRKLERTVIDTIAIAPERLNFEAAPICKPPLTLRNDVQGVIEGTRPLDVEKVIAAAGRKPLIQRVSDVWYRLKQGIEHAARAQREIYENEQVERLVREGHTRDHARTIVQRRMGGVLQLDDYITVRLPGRDETMTCAELLALPGDEYNVLDPIEPEHGFGYARFYRSPNSYNGPIISSFIHSLVYHIGRKHGGKREGRSSFDLPLWQGARESASHVALSAARAEMGVAISNAVRAREALLFARGSTGLGKTRATLRAIIERDLEDLRMGRTARRTLVLMNTHEQLEEKQREYDALVKELVPPNLRAAFGSGIMRGRISEGKGEREGMVIPALSPCLRAEEVQMAQGYGVRNIKQSMCVRKLTQAEKKERNTTDDYVRCPMWAACNGLEPNDTQCQVTPYFANVRECAASAVIFASFAYGTFWFADFGDFDTVVIDEDYLSHAVAQTTINVGAMAEEIDKVALDQRDKRVLSDIVALMSMSEPTDRTPEKIASIVGDAKKSGLLLAANAAGELRRLADLYVDMPANIYPDYDHAGIKREGERQVIWKIGKMLRMMADEITSACAAERGFYTIFGNEGRVTVTLNYARKLPPISGKLQNGTVLMLDGTADPEVAKAMMSNIVKASGTAARSTYIDWQVKHDFHVTQIVGKSIGRSMMERSRGEGDGVGEVHRECAMLVRKWARERRAKKLLVVCYLDDVEVFEELLQAAARRVEVRHFEVLRAVNEYEDFDACAIIGRPLSPVDAVQETAMALYSGKSDVKLELSGEYEKVQRPLDVNGGAPLAVASWGHPDPRVEAVRRHTCEALIEQAAGRLRAVNGGQKELLCINDTPVYAADEVLIYGDAVGLERDENARKSLGVIEDLLERDGVCVVSMAYVAKMAEVELAAARWAHEEAERLPVLAGLLGGGGNEPHIGSEVCPVLGGIGSDLFEPADLLLPGTVRNTDHELLSFQRDEVDEGDLRRARVGNAHRMFWVEATWPRQRPALRAVLSAISDPFAAYDRLVTMLPNVEIHRFGVVDATGALREFTLDFTRLETGGQPLRTCFDRDGMQSEALHQLGDKLCLAMIS